MSYWEYLKNRPPKQRKPQMSFSKKILIVSWISGSFVIAFALWLTYKMVIEGYSGDVSLIALILTGGFAEIATGTGFYYWKEKNENVNKQQLNPDYLKFEQEEEII
ncbi:hypothetical protein [Sporosarcina sp. FSL K6-3457]|uniref:hypothetical protein n=1 Tax=Sporosarcina sp. FSL K6-3457 TaxID=2978204 RepID=UPI0030F7DABB